ncbi:ATP-dependent DNA helicase DinG [Paenibacillus sp. YYML68]|uniref:ATP-dependent DNA helicase DinG n=1 Tax=Paenibacillus sp. YYML68 TaxID=2909250 RepID=UPI002492C096|nr:ATP-dependent DNA helicase DinG [Paenibacillus sp. YYML68]
MKFAVLDFETTGSTAADRIIQVGLAIVENMEITDRYTSLVNPGMSIPSSIIALTGLTDDMVKDAPTLDEVMAEVVPLLQDTALVGHNVGFDLAFLQRALDECGYFAYDGRTLDTLDVLRVVFPGLSSLQLSMVCNAMGIVHDRPHQADSDAEVTALIWLRCLERLQAMPLLTLQRMEMIFADSSNDFGWLVHEFVQYKEQQTADQADEKFTFHRQFALAVDDWGDEEPIRDEAQVQSLPDTFESFYTQLRESLKQRFASYEDREAQVIMINEVENAFQDSRHLLVEAGTGTGKSLGYLIPSLYYGLKHEKKVVVSTHTINLQEQLRERDLPLLHDLFTVPFQASVLKGRSHYLCMRKFEHKLNTLDFENGKDDRITAGQMLVWLGETKRGDEEELYFANKGKQFWHTVESDADSCLNRACPWFKKCFYHRARHEANSADVIITNHSLLFTDMKAENRLLPAYKHLVVDEAHHFEEVASKHLGMELHYHRLMNTLHALYKDSRSGQLTSLRIKLQQTSEDHRAAAWSAELDRAVEPLLALKEEWEQLTELLYQLLVMRSQDSAQSEGNALVYRLKKDTLPEGWDKLVLLAENMQLHFSEALKKLDKLVTELKEAQDEFDLQGQVTDLSGTVKDLHRHKDALQLFMTMPDDNSVYWLEGGTYNKNRSLQLHSVPIDVSSMLKQHFFEPKESVVLTSATLSVGKSFDYTCEQLGLQPSAPEAELKTVMLPSPFNYREQALVAIPRDFPTLRGGASGDKEFVDALVQSLAEVALETRGRMLVLFTSNRMLRTVHGSLKDMLSSFGISVLGQGVDSSNRSKLTRLFQSSPECVLLGTSSFWEGVDIPGDALMCLAIVRLPFQPPTHPLVEAKIEKVKLRNQNPFMKLSVPQAVIRFKQGFGRLVRTASDKGIVIIYDTRVIDTNYGKYFLYSLPGPKIEHMPSSQLVPRIKQWMEDNPS